MGHPEPSWSADQDALAPPCWSAPLFSAPVRWRMTAAGSGPAPSPRHQTLRRMGVAPPYERPQELQGSIPDSLNLSMEGLGLKRAGLFVPTQRLTARIFHADAAEFFLEGGARLLLGMEPRDAELLDVISQAYF